MKYIIKLLLIIIIYLFSFSGIITKLNTNDKIIAITFDACETKSPSFFDRKLLDFIVKNKIPVTLFLSGKFIERNIEDVKQLSQLPFIEIENHSYSHKDFRKLGESEIFNDIIKNEKLITDITGKKPTYFRFPYGYYDDKSVKIVEEMGYKIVHWSFESGDPDKKSTKESLIRNVIKKSKSGSILIFHINGRGWKTRYALPEIINHLSRNGYEFVLLKDVVK